MKRRLCSFREFFLFFSAPASLPGAVKIQTKNWLPRTEWKSRREEEEGAGHNKPLLSVCVIDSGGTEREKGAFPSL